MAMVTDATRLQTLVSRNAGDATMCWGIASAALKRGLAPNRSRALNSVGKAAAAKAR